MISLWLLEANISQLREPEGSFGMTCVTYPSCGRMMAIVSWLMMRNMLVLKPLVYL